MCQATWTQILIRQSDFLLGAYSPIEEILFVIKNLEEERCGCAVEGDFAGKEMGGGVTKYFI